MKNAVAEDVKYPIFGLAAAPEMAIAVPSVIPSSELAAVNPTRDRAVAVGEKLGR